MTYLTYNPVKPFVVGGKKQELRRARRSGATTHRQQKKMAVIGRRLAKLAGQ